MKKLVIDVAKGTKILVDLTPEEEAKALEMKAYYDANELPKKEKELADQADKDDIKTSVFTDKFIKFNKNELNKYFKDNVTDLPSAIDYLEKLSLIVMVLAKREFK